LAIYEFTKVPVVLPLSGLYVALMVDAAGCFPFGIEVATHTPALFFIIMFLLLLNLPAVRRTLV
jgi:hypothetical protein